MPPAFIRWSAARPSPSTPLSPSAGAAPLHAARLAEKLGIARIIVPPNAGVGSAVGFLRAPIAFEVVRSRHMRLSAFDPAAANAIIADMRAEALEVVRAGAGSWHH